MKQTGKITDWNDERGFGFIAPDDAGERIFLHISALQRKQPRPAVGDRGRYSTSRDPQGRARASAVHLASTSSQGFQLPRAIIGLGILLVVIAGYAMQLIPPMIAAAYGLFSLLSFLAYLKDKRAAKRKAWRTPESSLHLLDLLGGWPGGIIAQQLFHHKVSKTSFQIVFWLSVALNLGGCWWLVQSGWVARLLG